MKKPLWNDEYFSHGWRILGELAFYKTAQYRLDTQYHHHANIWCVTFNMYIDVYINFNISMRFGARNAFYIGNHLFFSFVHSFSRSFACSLLILFPHTHIHKRKNSNSENERQTHYWHTISIEILNILIANLLYRILLAY